MDKLKQTPAQMAKAIVAVEENVKQLRDFLSQGLLPSIDNAINQRIAVFDRALPALEALVSLAGRDAVAAEMVRLEKERTDKRIQEAKDTIAKNLEQGLIVETEALDEESMVVGTEFDKDGNVVEEWTSLAFAHIRPELKADFIGRKVGDEVAIAAGGKFKILNVYRHGIAAPEAQRMADALQPVAPTA